MIAWNQKIKKPKQNKKSQINLKGINCDTITYEVRNEIDGQTNADSGANTKTSKGFTSIERVNSLQ